MSWLPPFAVVRRLVYPLPPSALVQKRRGREDGSQRVDVCLGGQSSIPHPPFRFIPDAPPASAWASETVRRSSLRCYERECCRLDPAWAPSPPRLSAAGPEKAQTARQAVCARSLADSRAVSCGSSEATLSKHPCSPSLGRQEAGKQTRMRHPATVEGHNLLCRQ